MKLTAKTGPGNALGTLRRFAQPESNREICEFCSVPLSGEHRHLLEAASGKIICVCDPCALRFENVVGGRWKLVPRGIFSLPNLCLTDEQWESFALPINLVFFRYSTRVDKMVACYPSPAGATESLLPLSRWDALMAVNPILARMEADVEALLLNRMGDHRDAFVTPIDVCYELAGLIRVHWRGLSGGENVWAKVDEFFVQLRSRCADSPIATPEVIRA